MIAAIKVDSVNDNAKKARSQETPKSLIRLQETTANALEPQAIEKGYLSLPSYLADRIEQQHLNKTKSADAQ